MVTRTDTVSVCWQAGQGSVQTALSLVGYQKELESAMKFVFGTSFVCSDMDTAKRVTFDPKVMKKSVTLEGELFDPSGTLRGGLLLFILLVLTDVCHIPYGLQF